MRVIVTSVIRESVVGRQETGWIREIDWDRQEVVRELPVPPPRNLSSNDNPRGGLRGGRGVKHRDGKLFIANYDTVFVYGPDWRIEREISHPLSADIHEIALDGDAVWLSCSRTDLAIKLDFKGNRLDQWHITDAAEWSASRGLAPGPLDEERDYREQGVPDGVDLGHLNCVQVAGDDLILCLGKVRSTRPAWRRASAAILESARIVSRDRIPRLKSMSSLSRVLHQLSYATTCSVLAMNLKRRETRVLCTLPTIRPSHNGMLLSDRRIAINDSNQKLRILDAKGATMLALPIPGNWLRGLVEVDPNRLLVGVGPCGVAEVNLETQRVVKQLPLSENANESVHGLEVAPHGG